MQKKVLLAVTGASGQIYAARAIEILLSEQISLQTVFTDTAKIVWADELQNYRVPKTDTNPVPEPYNPSKVPSQNEPLPIPNTIPNSVPDSLPETIPDSKPKLTADSRAQTTQDSRAQTTQDSRAQTIPDSDSIANITSNFRIQEYRSQTDFRPDAQSDFRPDAQSDFRHNQQADLNANVRIPGSDLVFNQIDNNTYYHPFASGSNCADIMIIMPCTMGTIGRIAAGISNDLITRAADVMLKERKTLVIVPRETPYNLIHLRNLTTLAQAGAIIAPASPSFYTHPTSLDNLVDTFVRRVLNISGLNIQQPKFM